jgi:hypothetical protein
VRRTHSNAFPFAWENTKEIKMVFQDTL